MKYYSFYKANRNKQVLNIKSWLMVVFAALRLDICGISVVDGISFRNGNASLNFYGKLNSMVACNRMRKSSSKTSILSVRRRRQTGGVSGLNLYQYLLAEFN